MINRIENIRDFGVYKNFSWSSATGLKNFNHKNLFYGWNYSGKTTLSRIFSSLRDKKIHDSYDKSFFKVNTSAGDFDSNNLQNYPFEILVFNSDYVKDNLNFSIHKDEISESKTILFEVGDNAKFQMKIDSLKDQINLINGTDTIIGKKSKYTIAIDEFENYDKSYSGKFTILAKEIKDVHFISLINFTKANLKPIVENVKENLSNYIIDDRKRLIQLGEVVKTSEPKVEIDEIQIILTYSDIIKRTNKILSRIPDKDKLDKILDKNVEAYSWVKQGQKLNKANTKCLFCDNVINEDRMKFLAEYFNSQASNLKEEVEVIKRLVNDELTKLNMINIPSSSNDFNLGYIEEYKTLKKQFDKMVGSYKKHLNLILKKLQIKLNRFLYLPIDEIQEFKSNELMNSIKNINEHINNNNNFTKGFQHRIESERNLYKNHLVASFLKKEKYITKEKKYEKAVIEKEKLDNKVKNFEKEILVYESKKESDEEGAIQYTYFIQSFLNRDDIEINLEPESKKFLLLRGGENASNLSEGEKTAIAFSHFLVTIKSLESKGVFKDYIVFVDDPISSLDGNHIFQINSLMKETFFSQIPNPSNPKQNMWQMNCKQLFISTHNFEFMNLMKELPKSNGYDYIKNENKCKESRYFIERKGNYSTISKIPAIFDDFKSEYHYLFSVITTFNNDSNKSDSDKLLLMPNILRRFVEMYTLTQYPSKEEVDERANIVFGKLISKRILKPLNYFSHYNNIDNIGKQNELIADLPVACSSLIEYIKTKDEKHFKALNNAIS